MHCESMHWMLSAKSCGLSHLHMYYAIRTLVVGMILMCPLRALHYLFDDLPNVYSYTVFLSAIFIYQSGFKRLVCTWHTYSVQYQQSYASMTTATESFCWVSCWLILVHALPGLLAMDCVRSAKSYWILDWYVFQTGSIMLYEILSHCLLVSQCWRDIFADRELATLHVFCIAKLNGCLWTGPRQSLK